jgi:hypothetical protein
MCLTPKKEDSWVLRYFLIPLVVDMSFRFLMFKDCIMVQLHLQVVHFHLFATTILFINWDGFHTGCLQAHVGYACLFQILF